MKGGTRGRRGGERFGEAHVVKGERTNKRRHLTKQENNKSDRTTILLYCFLCVADEYILFLKVYWCHLSANRGTLCCFLRLQRARLRGGLDDVDVQHSTF